MAIARKFSLRRLTALVFFPLVLGKNNATMITRQKDTILLLRDEGKPRCFPLRTMLLVTFDEDSDAQEFAPFQLLFLDVKENCETCY